MASTAEPSCNFCDKRGLLILPVRYAIAPQELGAPPVAAPLKVEDSSNSVGNGQKQDLTLHGSAQYTTRLLRSGYLYVYDENRDRMDGYWITQDGYFMRFPSETTISGQAKSATPCHFAGHKELAGCIAVDDTEQSGVVWLGFSDVQWTPAVVQSHRGSAGKAQRELHMRLFDASAWAKAHQTQPGQPTFSDRGSTPHIVNIGALASTVAEYTAAPRTGQSPSSSFTPPSAPYYHTRSGAADTLLTAFRRRSPRLTGVIIALDDPVGVTQDLAALIQWRQQCLRNTRVDAGQFNSAQHADSNPYGSYGTTYGELIDLKAQINVLHSASDEKAKMDAFSTVQRLADTTASADYYAGGTLPIPPSFQLSNTTEIVPSKAQVVGYQERAWNDHLSRLSIDAMEAWQKECDCALSALSQRHIQPLARAHASWLQSNLLANKLECIHDGRDPLSGDVYTHTLQLCMASTSNLEPCKGIYRAWLKGNVTDKSNLLLRAMLLRQDALIDALAAAPLEPLSVPWQALIDQYIGHVNALLEPDLSAQMRALDAQRELAKARNQCEQTQANFQFATAMDNSPGDGPAPLGRLDEAETADDRLRTMQAQANQAMREADKKALPDSVASLLVQAGPAIAEQLRDLMQQTMTTLARWMVVAGVVIRAPANVIEISGSARDTIKATAAILVENLTHAAAQAGAPLSTVQIRQLTTYAERQVVSLLPTGDIASFQVKANGTTVKTRLAFFFTPGMSEELDAISDPSKKLAEIVRNVRMPDSLHAYGLLRIRRATPFFGAASEGVLAMIDTICKGIAWNQLLDDEAKAMSFQHAWHEDARRYLGAAAIMTSVGQSTLAVTKLVGTYRNVLATGLSERTVIVARVTRITKLIRVAGVVSSVLEGMEAITDIADGLESKKQKKYGLETLQFASGLTGITSVGVGGWSILTEEGIEILGFTLGGWGVILALLGWALSTIVDEVKGTLAMQWLERCYWGRLSVEFRYQDGKQSTQYFKKAIIG